MNTDKHGLKKYFVVLKKTKNGVGMGSVYFSENLKLEIWKEGKKNKAIKLNMMKFWENC